MNGPNEFTTNPAFSTREGEVSAEPDNRLRHGAADSAVPFFLAFLVLIGIVYGGWTWYRINRFKAESTQALPDIGPPIPAGDFELTERSGKPFRSADMKGKVWVATYFFTTCPGECIRLNRNIQVLEKTPELKDVTWVSITCDPETDDLETLKKYADSMEADSERWLFCRADLDYTQRVALGMKLFLSRQGHTNYAIVIDKTGAIRGMFEATSTSDCQRMQKLLEKLLAEEPQQPSNDDRDAASPESEKS